MISIVIPTQGNEAETVATLAALVPGSAAGMVRDVVLVERAGGSGNIERVADVAGCRFLTFEGSRADEIARPRAVIELVGKDAVPAVAARARRARQREDECRARHPRCRATLDRRGADLG